MDQQLLLLLQNEQITITKRVNDETFPNNEESVTIYFQECPKMVINWSPGLRVCDSAKHLYLTFIDNKKKNASIKRVAKKLANVLWFNKINFCMLTRKDIYKVKDNTITTFQKAIQMFVKGRYAPDYSNIHAEQIWKEILPLIFVSLRNQPIGQVINDSNTTTTKWTDDELLRVLACVNPLFTDYDNLLEYPEYDKLELDQLSRRIRKVTDEIIIIFRKQGVLAGNV